MLGLLKDLIELNKGSIPFSKFMETALYNKDHGYYCISEPIGAIKGDFITAPEISQLFGESLAIWLANRWDGLNSKGAFFLVDLGPGRGTMMADILRALERVPKVFRSIEQVYMVEISPALKIRQQNVLAGYSTKIRWVEGLSEVPESLPAFFIGNEFLDAMPVDQFIFDGQTWKENRVAWDGQKLIFCHEDVELAVHGMESGMVIESSEMAKSQVSDIARRIRKFGGGALFIDYGYNQKPYVSTIQAVSKHGYHRDILIDPGKADITAFVDFAALGLGAIQSQRDFLASMGFFELANLLMHRASKLQQFEIIAAVDRLTSPLKMGSVFKVAQL